MAAALQSGCATVIKGSHQEVPVASEPAGAAVLVDGVRQGTTPTRLHVSRKDNHVVSIVLDGYESENISLQPSIGGAVAGNILAGGLIGWGVDASTGAQYNLHPDNINVHLHANAPPPVASADASPRSSVSGLLSDLDKLDAMKQDRKITEAEYADLRAAALKKYQSPDR